MKLKTNLQNWITTIVGVLVILAGIYTFVIERIETTGLVTLIVLGWVLIMSKDELIEDLFMNLFKIKKRN